MNIMALISAGVGLLLLILIVVFGNKIKNRWLRYLSVIVGIVLAMGVAGNLPSLLGASDVKTSAKASEYMVYLGVALVIIKSIFFRKKEGA